MNIAINMAWCKLIRIDKKKTPRKQLKMIKPDESSPSSHKRFQRKASSIQSNSDDDIKLTVRPFMDKVALTSRSSVVRFMVSGRHLVAAHRAEMECFSRKIDKK